MSKGINFSDFTYGVGLEIKAESFKQVKDDLKLNLDSLSKMVKSYGKVLKIDPNADLSKLFEQMRKLQSIVDGIDGSDNSFSGFVDKGTLSRIAALEDNLTEVNTTSEEVKVRLSELKSNIASLTETLKAAGAVKFPATFENLFGNTEDQSAKIKNLTEQINKYKEQIKVFSSTSNKIDSYFNGSQKINVSNDVNQISDWIIEFENLKDKLEENLSPDELYKVEQEIADIGIKLHNTLKNMPSEEFVKFKVDSQYVEDIESYIVEIESKYDKLQETIKKKQKELEVQLNEVKSQQTKYDAKNALRASSGKSLGVQSDYTAQVKVDPKTNEAEWVAKINDTIKNIEPRLVPVVLTPTFSKKTKNTEKEIDGNLAEINHAISVDLKVTDNLEQFNEKIKNIDTSIKNAKKQLEQNGNFKIKFEYEEGGKFKDAAYQIINKFKKIEANFYIANGKKFLQDIAGLREKSKKELKDIPITFTVGNNDAVLSSVSSLRSEIENKIGNIGVNLKIGNMPQFTEQVNGISRSVGTGSNAENIVIQLSEKAKQAQVIIEKIKIALKSLSDFGFKSPEFLKLGAFDENLKYIKDSKEQIQKLLQLYNQLSEKLSGDKQKILATYGAGDAGYQAYQKDVDLLKKTETALNAILQSQIKYSQHRLELAEQTLERERQISSTKKNKPASSSNTNTNTGNTSQENANNKLAASAEDATKKVKSLNGTLTQQKKVLQDLEKNGINSKSLIRLGEWDENSNSFKKNSKEIQALVQKYQELKKARQDAGGKKAAGEEVTIRNQLINILKQQKIHQKEIIAQTDIELQKAKKVIDAYKSSSKIGQSSNKPNNKTQSSELDQAIKKQEELQDKLERTRAIWSELNKTDFSKNNISDFFVKIGEWDDKTSSFKKNSQDMQELINKYKQFKEVNDVAKNSKWLQTIESGRRAVESNISKQKELLEQLNTILEKQKQHIVEIGNKYKQELGTIQTTISDLKSAGTIDEQISSTSTYIDKLIEKLNKAKTAVKQLSVKKNNFNVMGKTGLGDLTDVFGVRSTKEGLLQIIDLYNKLTQKQLELRKSGQGQSSEYKINASLLKDLRAQLESIYNAQLEYSKTRVQQLEIEIAKEKKKKQQLIEQKKTVEQQKAAEQRQKTQPKAKSTKNVDSPTAPVATPASATASTTTSIVKLDGHTLNSLAKDATLKSIDGKIANIVNNLGKSLKISGNGITIKADNVNVDSNPTSGVDTKKKQTDNSKFAHQLAQEMSNGMKDRIDRANALSKAGIKISRGTLLRNGADAFDEILKGVSPQDIVQAVIWPKLVQQLKAKGLTDTDQFNEILAQIATNSTWKSKTSSSWIHFATPDAKFSGSVTKKAYAAFSNVGDITSELINQILNELKSKGYKGQIKIPNDITGFYDTDQIVGHAANDQSFMILVDTLKKFEKQGILSNIQTGVDANTKVSFGYKGKQGASFTTMLEEIYKAVPGEIFSVDEIKSIIRAAVASTSGEVDQALFKPIVEDVIRKRNEQTLNISDVSNNQQIAASAGEATQKQSELNNELIETNQRTNAKQADAASTNQNITTSAEGATQEQKALNDELERTQELSSSVEVFSEGKGDITKRVDTYKSSDKVNETQEVYQWVKRGKDDPGQLEHTSTIFKTNQEAYNKLYQKYIDALAKQYEIEEKIKSSSGSTTKLQEELNIQKEITKELESQLNSHAELYTKEAKDAANVEAKKKATQATKTSNAGENDEAINKKIASLNKVVDSAKNAYNQMLSIQSSFSQGSMNGIEMPLSDSAIKKIEEYGKLLEQLKLEQQKIASNPSLIQDEDYSKDLNELLGKINKAKKDFDSLNQSSIRFFSNIKNASDIKILGKDFNPNNLNQMHDAMRRFANEASNGEAKLIKFNDINRTATFEIKNGKGQVQQLTVAYNEATNSLGRYVSKTTDAVSTSKQFFDGIKKSFGNVARYLASFGSVYQLIAMVKQGYTYVKEIDSALTELKKVTDETNATYDKFLQTMSKTAGVVGSTVSELTSSAADWARLGYSIEEAGELAKNTTILMNVSEFDDINTATDTLISSLQAFKNESTDVASFSMQIIDAFNEVGNNYAISTSDLADSLTRSSAALVAANNSLEESIALTTAANTTIQDPDSVGNALKVVSMRIRGVKSELEDAGEETEGMITNTAKLQKQVMALTNVDGNGGINILTETGEFKSTYNILLSISKVWDKMSDASQASLLELIAGKTRGSVVASLFQNGNILESAYESAINSSGSAARELNTYLDSIEGRLGQLTNSIQTLWMNFLDTSAVKTFISILDVIVKLIDKVGVLNTVVSLLMARASFKSGKFLFSPKNILPIIKSISSWITNLKAAHTTAIATTASINQLSGAQAAQAGAAEVAAGANNVHAASETAVGAAAAGATPLVKMFWAAATMGISLIAGFALPKIIQWFDDLYESSEELAERVDELTDSYKTAKKEFSDNLEILTTTNTEGYDDLLSEFNDLKDGVNKLGENISLTTEEYGRYKEICEQIVGVNPSLVEGYNNATQAISDNKGALAQLIELQKEEARLNAAEFVSYGRYSKNGNFESLAQNALTTYDTAYTKFDQYIDAQELGLLDLFNWKTSDYGLWRTEYDDLAQFIMEKMGIAPDQIDEALEKYYYEQGTEFLWEKWTADYIDDIVNSKQKLLSEIESMKKTDDAIGDPRLFAQQALEYSGKDFNGPGFFNGNGIEDILNTFTENDVFNYDAFLEEYGGYIGAYKDYVLNDARELINNTAVTYKDLQSALEKAQEGMISTFLEVPNAVEEYDQLSNGTKKFITGWIKNSEMFKIDKNTTEEAILAAKQTIIDTIQNIANGEYTTTIEGKTVSAQKIIDQMMEIDDSVDLGKYKKSVKKLLELLWNSFDDAAKEVYGDQKNLAKMLGFELVYEDEEEGSDYNNLLADISRITGLKVEELQDAVDSLPVSTIKLMYQIDWDPIEAGSMTLEEMVATATPNIKSLDIPVIQSYSGLKESIDSFNEVLETSNELFTNGVKTTEDYYNSLLELGIADTDLGECIDKNNGYIVTNADKLKELLKLKKEEIVVNTKLFKAHAELQYSDIIQSISDQITSTTTLENANRELVDSLFDQASALKATINQYQLLENSLLGTSNAFTQFSKAQEIDSQNTYGSTLVEMAQTMYDAIYKTGEVGSEAFWAAVKATVPDDIYMGLMPGDAQIKAIARYLQDNLFSGLTISGDSFSIDYSSIESFIKKAQAKGLFSGTDTKAFSLSPIFMNSLKDGEDALKKFADQMGVTEEYVYAMFSEIDKYNTNGIGLSMLFQLDSSTSSQLTILNTQLEQALATRKRLLEQGADLAANTKEISYLQSQQAGVKAQATANTTKYLTVANALEDPTKDVTEVLSGELIAEIGIQIPPDQIITVQDVFQEISDWLLQLEEPTILDLKISKESIQDSIQGLENEFGKEQLKADLQLLAEGGTPTIDKETLQKYEKLLSIDQFIDDAMSANLTTTESLLTQIAKNTGIMAGTEEAPSKEEGAKNNNNNSNDNNTGNNDLANSPQSEKPAPNTLGMETYDNILRFQRAITKKQMELSKFGVMNFQQQYEYDELAKIAGQSQNINDNIISGAISAEDAWRQFQKLQTQARQFGITVPVRLKVDKEEASSDIDKALNEIESEQDAKDFLMKFMGYTSQQASAKTENYVDWSMFGDDIFYVDQFKKDIEEARAEVDGLGETAQETKEEIEQLFTVKVPDSEAIKMLNEVEDKQAILTNEDAAILGLSIDDGAVWTVQQALDAIIARNQQLTAGLYNVKQISIDTYSELKNQVASYNDILSQSDEVVSTNTKVTQEYHDALVKMADNKEDVIKCFGDETSLIVKDTKAHDRLVKSAKKNTVQNVKLAKSQAQLQYYELYKEMVRLTNGQKITNQSTLSTVNSLYAEMTALQKTIAKFSMLEAQLLGTANAYEKLSDAQQIDSDNDYGSKAEELINVLAEAFNTAELGTEAAQVAIAGLIPDDVIDKSKTLDEQMQQIYDYFTGGEVSKLFTIEFNDDGGISSVEMTKENVEDYVNELLNKTFVKDGVDMGTIFSGTWDEFTLNPEIKTLEDFADACNITKEVAFAFLTSLEKYDISWLGGDASTLLDQLMGDNLEYQIYNTTQKMADLQYQLANGKISAEEYRESMSGLSKQQKELAEQAATETSAYYDKSEQLKDASERLMELQTQLETGLDSNGDPIDVDQVNKDIASVLEEIDILAGELSKLEEPTAMTITLASEYVQEQIDDIEESIKELAGDDKDILVNIETKFKEVEENGFDLTKFGLSKDSGGNWTGIAEFITSIGLDPNDETVMQTVTNYINLVDKQHTLELLMGSDTPNVIDTLENISIVLQAIADKLGADYTLNVKTNVDTDEVTSFLDTPLSKTISVGLKMVGDWISSRRPFANGTAHANGTTHNYKSGTAHAHGSWGAPKTETALVGELGPEMRVRGSKWELIGENGAEFTDVRRGDIIFNHKQTEDLLSKGYVTGRGKAFASGTAYAKIDTWDDAYGKVKDSYSNTSGSELSKAAGDLSDAADEFREVFDWIEVRIEEINERIDLKNAKLENAVGSSKQNAIIDDIISLNQKLYDNLTAGASEYYQYSEKLLAKVPSEYRKAAQDGSIAIEEFVKETDEETINAIQEYRDWVQKGADLTQQAEETLTEISNLAKQAIDNIASDYENKTSIGNNKIDQYEAYNSLLETDKGSEAASIYQAMIKENNKNIKILEKQRNDMQAELDKRVKSGQIKKYSQDWYDAVNDIAAVDTEIINLKTDTENYQDSVNELHWDRFDELINRLDSVSSEAENLIDILGNKDAVEESGEWTKEGITSLGLYAQQMEVAEVQAKKYKEEINYLNKNWKKLGYTEQEYVDKLNELKEGQYDAIKAYHESKDAIVELNKTRVEAIKEGIQKEIDAYEELISKKKEELDAEKDLHDFQKGIMEQQKDIADIERKLAALASDNSASARAQRAKLEAELLQAKADLEESYYDRSVSDQQDALDKELENFQDAKNEEMEGWDKYLEDTEQVVADSLDTITANTDVVYQTLKDMGKEYGLSITESLTSPWKEGENAIQSFSEKFGVSMSATVDELKELEVEFKQTMLDIEQAGIKAADTVKENATRYQAAEKQNQPSGGGNGGGNAGNGGGNGGGNSYPYGKASDTTGNIQKGAQGNSVKAIQYALNQLGYGNSGTSKVDGIFGSGTQSAVKAFQRAMGISADGIVGKNTRAKFKAQGYALGTTGVKKDQFALIDELGEELVLHAGKNGRLEYLSKGTSVVPSDITENLMKLGQLDPSAVLDYNRPIISAPNTITNNNIELNMEFGEVVHIDTVTNDTIPDLTKAVEKQMDKYMKGLNNQIRKYVR